MPRLTLLSQLKAINIFNCIIQAVKKNNDGKRIVQQAYFGAENEDVDVFMFHQTITFFFVPFDEKYNLKQYV